MVSVVGLTGCVAVFAVDLFIRAKDDQIAKRFEYAEPLPKNGLGVGVVFQQVGGVDEIQDPVPEPVEILGFATELYRQGADVGIRLRQIDPDGVRRDRVAAGAKVNPATGAVGSKASPALRGLALPDRGSSADCSCNPSSSASLRRRAGPSRWRATSADFT